MLYDNALLSVAYLEAFQLTKNQMFAQVTRETLDYVLREMTSDEGGFYCAQDAGEVDKEGEFYVWSEVELKQLLSAEQLAAVQKTYGVSAAGNFEHATNIFNLKAETNWEERSTPTLVAAKNILLSARAKRQAPHKDDKVITSWNGLMISAMANAYQVLRDQRYLQAAERAASFIETKLYPNGQLLRRYRDGRSDYSASLDDYSYLIQGLINLYESDFNQHWLDFARKLQAALDRTFWDAANHGYFFSHPEDSSLIVRRKDFADEAIPSANSIAALNLLKLHDLTFDRALKTKATQLLNAMSSQFNRYPSAFASALIALDYLQGHSKQIVIIGAQDDPTGIELRNFAWETFLPNKILAWGAPGISENTDAEIFRGKIQKEGHTTFYICQDHSCKLPTTSVDQAKKQMAPVE